MKILVTGANGQVGTDLVIEAKSRGHEVWGAGSSALDITSADSIKEALNKFQPELLINAAAYTAVDRAETEQELAYAVNADAVALLAEACKGKDIPLLHISTDYVFDGEKPDPYIEADEPNPTGVYGASKLKGEQLLQQLWPKHLILRVSWVFGAHGNNFVKTMLRLAGERDQLSVVNDQYGAPTSATDIANTLLDAVEAKGFGREDFHWGLYHLESNPGVTWYEFANEIFKQAVEQGGLEKAPQLTPITSDQYPTPVKRPKNSKLSSVKAGGFLEVPNWQQALQEMLSDSLCEAGQ